MESTDIRAHVRLNTFAEWTSKAALAAFDIPYHSHPGGTSQGAGKVFSQLFAFQRTQRPADGTSALTSGPVSTTIRYGRLDDLRQGFPPLFDVFAAWVPLGPAFYMPRFPVCLCGRANLFVCKTLCLPRPGSGQRLFSRANAGATFCAIPQPIKKAFRFPYGVHCRHIISS